MSEEKQDSPKITTVVKQKNPLRVEAGKQLATISKQAKEQKMCEKLEKENQLNDNQDNYNYTHTFGLS